MKGVSHLLAVLVLGCLSSACGPSRSVDRGSVIRPPDGAGGSTGFEDIDAAGGAGGTGGSEPDADDRPDPDAAVTDADPPSPDAPPPDATDAADAAAPDAPPPADAAAPDGPALPLVEVSVSDPAATTDLTSQGTTDWMHWGLQSAATSTRKRGGPGLISMTLTQPTTLSRYNDRPVFFSWSDGDPTATVASTAFGIDVGDAVGRGYEIRVTGNPARARTVRAHLGVWGARARMAISLAGQSDTLYADTSLSATDPGADRIYTITFQPAVQSQVLVLRWTVDALIRSFGNVTLQAVSVAEAP